MSPCMMVDQRATQALFGLVRNAMMSGHVDVELHDAFTNCHPMARHACTLWDAMRGGPAPAYRLAHGSSWEVSSWEVSSWEVSSLELSSLEPSSLEPSSLEPSLRARAGRALHHPARHHCQVAHGVHAQRPVARRRRLSLGLPGRGGGLPLLRALARCPLPGPPLATPEMRERCMLYTSDSKELQGNLYKIARTAGPFRLSMKIHGGSLQESKTMVVRKKVKPLIERYQRRS